MKIMTDKKFNEIKRNNYNLGVKETEEKYNSTLEGIVAENQLKESQIKNLEKTNFDLDGENKELKDKLKLANEEMETLKENVRKAYSCSSKVTSTPDGIRLEVTKEPVKEEKTKKKSVKKVVDEIVADINEKKSTKKAKSKNSNIQSKITAKITVDDLKKAATDFLEPKKESKKRGRKNNATNSK